MDNKIGVQHVVKTKTSKGQDMRLRLFDVIEFLKEQGYNLENTFISYYSSVFSSFINCNLDPIQKTIWLTDDDLELIDSRLSLRLKFTKGLRWKFTDHEFSEVTSSSCSEEEKDDHEKK